MDRTNPGQGRGRPNARMMRGCGPGEAVTTAVGWILLGTVLLRELALVDAGLVLVTFGVAEFGAALLVAGWADLLEEQAKRSGAIWQSAVGAVMLRWLVMSTAIVGASTAGFMPFFASHPMSVLALIGIPLLVALLHLATACRAALSYRPSWSSHGRHVLLAGSILAVTYSDSPDVATVLLLAILVLLLLLSFSLVGLPSLFRETATIHVGMEVAQRCFLRLGPFFARNIDLVMVPWLLSPTGAAVFLIARGMACVVSLASDQLQRFASETINLLYAYGPLPAFYAAAARLNLALLLVGGGSAVAAMAVGDFAANYLSSDMTLLPEVVFWLALGRCDTSIFGAAPLLMEVSTMRRMRSTLCWSGALVLGIVLSFSNVNQALLLAQYVSMCQLAIGASCALVLGQRHGVWPGLTALFQQRIKLL